MDFHSNEYGQVIHAFQLVLKSNGACLDIAAYGGSGNIGTYHCDGYHDQFFWFKNRGKVVKSGQIFNAASNLCLDVAGTEAYEWANVFLGSCTKEVD